MRGLAAKQTGGENYPPVKNQRFLTAPLTRGAFLAKSAGVAAFAAEFFSGLPMGEAFVNGLCPGRCQDFFHVLMKQITQRQVAVMV